MIVDFRAAGFFDVQVGVNFTAVSGDADSEAGALADGEAAGADAEGELDASLLFEPHPASVTAARIAEIPSVANFFFIIIKQTLPRMMNLRFV